MCHRIGDGDASQTDAERKCAVTNSCNGIGDSDACQAFTVFKYTVFYMFHGIGDSDACQTGAERECILSDMSD